MSQARLWWRQGFGSAFIALKVGVPEAVVWNEMESWRRVERDTAVEGGRGLVAMTESVGE